jgi:hypothetical protein
MRRVVRSCVAPKTLSISDLAVAESRCAVGSSRTRTCRVGEEGASEHESLALAAGELTAFSHDDVSQPSAGSAPSRE